MKTKPGTKYQVGDIISAVDKGVYYNAKILKVFDLDNTRKYFIHYLKFSYSDDCWIDESLLAPKLDSSKPQPVLAVSSPSKVADGHPSAVGVNDEQIGESKDKCESSSSNALETIRSRKKKLKELYASDLVHDEEEARFPENCRINIPHVLKRHLVDEWTLITQEPKRLLRLPRPKSKTVKVVVQKFLDSPKLVNMEPLQVSLYRELFYGLTNYFDRALPRLLLYRHERAQHERLVAAFPNQTPSSLYGSEHFLRLFGEEYIFFDHCDLHFSYFQRCVLMIFSFSSATVRVHEIKTMRLVKLPRLLTSAFAGNAQLTDIQRKLHEFLKFLQKESSSFVEICEYQPATEVLEMELHQDSGETANVDSAEMSTEASCQSECTERKKKRTGR